MAVEFEAANPGIKVNVTVLPASGFDEKMTTALGAGEGAPDVAFFWDNNWYPEALELTPYIEADPDFDPDMYFPGFWKTRAMWGDKVVGLPLGVGANFVMYHKDVFDAAGVAYPEDDWTTEDFIYIATQLTNPDQKSWGGDRPRGPYRAGLLQLRRAPLQRRQHDGRRLHQRSRVRGCIHLRICMRRQRSTAQTGGRVSGRSHCLCSRRRCCSS